MLLGLIPLYYYQLSINEIYLLYTAPVLPMRIIDLQFPCPYLNPRAVFNYIFYPCSFEEGEQESGCVVPEYLVVLNHNRDIYYMLILVSMDKRNL